MASLRTKVLLHGVHPEVRSGYGKTIHHMAKYLSTEFDVGIFAYVGPGGKVKEIDGITLFPNFSQDRGQTWLDVWAKYFGAQVIISHMDHWAIPGFWHNATKLPVIMYVVSGTDCTPIPKVLLKAVEPASRVVLATKFAQQGFAQRGIDIQTVIPQCQDANVFYPRDKAECKRKLGIPEDEFTFLSVAANGTRKNLPNTLKAYQMFLDHCPQAKKNSSFLLHTYPVVDANWTEGFDLREFVDDLDIGSNVRFADPMGYLIGLEEEEMAVLYNSADILVSTSYGEGFCLPLIEAGSCEVPAIGTTFSAYPEIIGEDRGWLVDIVDHVPFQRISSWQALPSTNEIARIMEIVYLDKTEVECRGKRAREFALRHSWENIMPSWYSLIQQVGVGG